MTHFNAFAFTFNFGLVALCVFLICFNTVKACLDYRKKLITANRALAFDHSFYRDELQYADNQISKLKAEIAHLKNAR